MRLESQGRTTTAGLAYLSVFTLRENYTGGVES